MNKGETFEIKIKQKLSTPHLIEVWDWCTTTKNLIYAHSVLSNSITPSNSLATSLQKTDLQLILHYHSPEVHNCSIKAFPSSTFPSASRVSKPTLFNASVVSTPLLLLLSQPANPANASSYPIIAQDIHQHFNPHTLTLSLLHEFPPILTRLLAITDPLANQLLTALYVNHFLSNPSTALVPPFKQIHRLPCFTAHLPNMENLLYAMLAWLQPHQPAPSTFTPISLLTATPSGEIALIPPHATKKLLPFISETDTPSKTRHKFWDKSWSHPNCADPQLFRLAIQIRLSNPPWHPKPAPLLP